LIFSEHVRFPGSKPRNGTKAAKGSMSRIQASPFLEEFFVEDISRVIPGLQIMGPSYGKLPILFPYYSHIFRESYGSGMEIVSLKIPLNISSTCLGSGQDSLTYR